MGSEFEKDLLFVANKVSKALNMFNETQAAQNKLLTVYGHDEFIALLMTVYEDKPGWGSLRLRTRDMAATWNNVPVGFSQINESKGLLASMKKAAKLSLKRNSLWYIDKQLKDAIGERIKFTEITTNRGWLYKVTFTNDYIAYLTLIKEDSEYYKPHDEAQLYFFCKKDKTPVGAPLTADECLMLLVEIAQKEDRRVAEFVNRANEYGGRSAVTHSYRVTDESLDEAKCVFNNGYSIKFSIINGELQLELYGMADDGQMYILDARAFEDVNDIFNVLHEFSTAPKYIPGQTI